MNPRAVHGGFLTALLVTPMLVGCGDDGPRSCTGSGDDEALRGSFCEGSEISYDTIELGWLPTSQTLRIRYGFQEETRVSPSFEIQLLGTQVVLETGVSIPVRTVGFVRRWPEGATEAQLLTDQLANSSNVSFETLELQAGGAVKGQFNLLFDSGRTLSGTFEGTFVDLTPSEG